MSRAHCQILRTQRGHALKRLTFSRGGEGTDKYKMGSDITLWSGLSFKSIQNALLVQRRKPLTWPWD